MRAAYSFRKGNIKLMGIPGKKREGEGKRKFI